MSSELRFFRQFFETTSFILFLAGELYASADLLHTDWATVLDHHPHLTVIQGADQFNELLFRFGQYDILFALHFISSKNKKLRQ